MVRPVRLLSLALLLVPGVARAQEARDTVRLQDLIVTATRLPASSDKTIASHTVIRGEELRARGIPFVLDALRDVPGMAVVQQGSIGGITSVFLRGGESNYVKVLIDGVAVNQPGGAFNWAHLTTANVDRIEVIRGPASVLYGSDAMSGVVQVFTRRGTGRPRVELQGEGGTFGTVDWSGGIRGGSEALSYSADVSRLTTDGIYDFNSAYRNTVLSGSLRARLDARSEATVSLRAGDDRFGFPTNGAGAPVDSNQFNDDRSVALAVDVGRRFNDRYEVRLTATGSQLRSEFDNRSDSPGDTMGFGFAAHRNTRGRRGSVDARVNAYVTPFLTVTAGAQVERETERQTGVSTSNFGGIATTPDTPFDRGRTTVGYYAQGVVDLASGLAVNLNGRLDDNSAFGTFFTFRAGAGYRLPSGTRFRALVGRAFKTPTFCEQFCDAPFVVGDSGLKPERATTWEAGVEQTLARGRLTLHAAYFDQRFRDLIYYYGSAGPDEATYRNGVAARARGIEGGASVALTGTVRASVSYTWLDAEATDDAGQPSDEFTAGRRLLRRPVHSGQLSLHARPVDRLSLAGALVVVGKRDDADFSTFPATRVELPTYATVGLSAQYDVLSPAGSRPGVTVTLRGENLFDAEYDTVVGFPGRERAVYGGVRLGW